MAIGLREDVALTLVVFGVVLVAIAWRQPTARPRTARRASRSRRARLRSPAWALAAGAAAALVLYYGVITPRLGGWTPCHFYVYSFADGPIALVAPPFTHPVEFARAIFTFGRFTYVLEALVPLLFLPLRSWWTLLALPGGAVVLLANSGYVWRMGDHYAALWIPWLLVATVASVASLARQRSERVAARTIAFAGALCALFLIAFDPAHPLHYLHSYYGDLDDARRALGCVPKDASLSTHDEWFSAVAAQRPRATIDRARGVEYLVYAGDYPNVTYRARVRPALAAKSRAAAIASSADLEMLLRIGSSMAAKIPGPSRWETLRGSLPGAVQALSGFLALGDAALRKRRRVRAPLAILRLRQRARADQRNSGHAAASVFEVARHRASCGCCWGKGC